MHSSALPRRRLHAHKDPQSADRALAEADAHQRELRDRQAAQREALYVGGRLLLALVFIGSAVAKASAHEPNTSASLGGLFWLSLALEVICGGLLALGVFARATALALLCWVGIGVAFFHGDLSQQVNVSFALANLGIAGGLFLLVARGGGLLSVDRWWAKKNAPRPID